MADPAWSYTSISGLATTGFKAKDFLGRFELRRVLGQGAQSTVWLAFDPRMEREVAIKVMRPGSGSDEAAVAAWLQEARSVGKVSHANIIPVYEADIHGRQPYLVFEYIAGKALDQILTQRGALPPGEAVALMMDVLDAVSVAHAAGVVHRDLKPSNILVDSAGRARVMDFGIAARIRDSKALDPGGGGTVGYISPEAANGATPSPAMDIFSAGMVIAELLAGKPLIQEKDPFRAVYRVIHEQMVLPSDLHVDVDESLRAIVTRALAKDPKERYPTARAFLGALEQWAKPVPKVGDHADTQAGGGTLEFLLRRMRHKSDFPAMSASVARIQSMATSETESVNSVTNEILKDVALTNKLLRLVNSVHYARGSSISTVSRAVTLVGFNGIRNMSLSLVLLEHMQDKAQAAQLKEEFLRSLMAGSIGAELCPVQRESEEAFIGSMFQHLGRLLVQYYFAEEASEIRKLQRSEKQPMSESAASASVLGISFEELGVGIAKAWGLPSSIQHCMRRPAGAPPGVLAADAQDRVRWVAMVANEVSDVLLRSEPHEVDAKIALIARHYAKVTGISAKTMDEATRKARQKLLDLAAAMEIRVAPGSNAAKLLTLPDSAADGHADGATAAKAADAQIVSLELHATQRMPTALQAVQSQQVNRVADALTAGIQDITNAMVEDFKLTDILRMVLETMYRALAFDRVIFCMRDAKTELMTGRFGLGNDVERQVKLFRIPLKAATPDLMAVVCLKGSDTLIQDARQGRIAERLPEWFRKSVDAPTFLLLPLQIKGAPFGLIYADKIEAGALELNERELALLRTLRNQAVMAFKQSS